MTPDLSKSRPGGHKSLPTLRWIWAAALTRSNKLLTPPPPPPYTISTYVSRTPKMKMRWNKTNKKGLIISFSTLSSPNQCSEYPQSLGGDGGRGVLLLWERGMEGRRITRLEKCLPIVKMNFDFRAGSTPQVDACCKFWDKSTHAQGSFDWTGEKTRLIKHT